MKKRKEITTGFKVLSYQLNRPHRVLRTSKFYITDLGSFSGTTTSARVNHLTPRNDGSDADIVGFGVVVRVKPTS